MVNITVSGKGEGNYKGLETGIYNARCDLIADLGMQETKFGDKHKLYIRFAVPDQVVEGNDGEFQMSIGTTLTASLSKKANLRKMLESWRGKPFTEEELEGFELTNLLNAPATLVVGSYLKDGEERAKLDNVIRCKSEVGKLFREPAAFSVDSSPEELEAAPEWIREKIQFHQQNGGHASGEAEQQNGAAHQAEDERAALEGYPDDIPF